MLEVDYDGRRHRVRAGERLTFGRGDDVDLLIAHDPGLHRHCGTVVVLPDGWDLHNAGRWLQLRIVASGRPGFDLLPPGESIRVPWPVARLELFSGRRWYTVVARFTPDGGRRTGVAGASGAGGAAALGEGSGDPGDAVTSAAVRLDRASGYFRALVALCEPQLRDPASGRVATDLEIVRRLNRLAIEPGRVTGKTVERRLDNCRRHFGLKRPDADLGVGAEHGDARRRLVDLALATGAVSVGDLDVLGPPVAAATTRTPPPGRPSDLRSP